MFQREEIVRTGPLPPPSDLAQYEQISLGFADRIMSMAEREQTHRHKDTDDRLVIQGKLAKRGQIFGFILSLVIILGGLGLVWMDKPTSGFVAILAGIATVAGPFIYSRLRKKPPASKSD